MIVEHRASIILFNILSSIEDKSKRFLLPANICPIVVLTYLKAGVAFEFVDITDHDLCLDEKVALRKLSTDGNTYGGIHYVHTFGLPNNPSEFFARVKSISSDFIVIDDKCLNIPEFRTYPLPDNIDLELFSTGYSKYVDIGWGGFGYLQAHHSYQQRQLPYKLKDLEQLTALMKDKLEGNTSFEYSDSDWLGDTSFLVSQDEYQQEIVAQRVAVNSHKDVINSLYSDGLPKEIQFPLEFQNWRFNIKVPEKNVLLKNVFESGLFASSHYASITGLFGGDKALCAEKSNADTVNLFNDFRVDVTQTKKMIAIINDHLLAEGSLC